MNREHFEMFEQFKSRLPVVVIATSLVFASWQTICEARDLFQLVDQDAVACLHARQLDAQWQRLRESEFGDRLQHASFFRDWIQSPDYKQLELVRVAVEAASGKPLAQSRRELFSQDVVLAWYHTPGTKADLARNSVLLIEVESPAVAKSALATWNVLERQRTETKKFQDTTYTHSVKANADENARGFFYAIFDDVLVLSTREDRIQRTIELAGAAAASSAAEVRTSSQASGHPDCLATYAPFAKAFARRPKMEIAGAYVNPRVLVSELGRANKDFSAIEATLARCQWLTLSLAYDDSVKLDVIADYDSQGTPDWWKQWLQIAETARSSGQPLPPDSLVAMSGRVASPSISAMILNALQDQTNLPKDLVQARRVAQGLLLGLDPVADILPAVGPSWIFSIQPRDSKVSTSFPVDAVFAIEMKSAERQHPTGNDEEPVSPEAALENSLQSGLGVLAVVHNVHATGQRVSIVKQRRVNGATIHFADPVAFFQPAFMIADGYLVLATTPELCESFLKTAAETGNESLSAFGNLQNVVASSIAIRKMLASQKEWFIRQAQRDKVPEADALKRLEQLDQFLALLDRAWMTANVDATTLRISAGIAADASPSNEAR
tara:strand:+ start:202574 stop:204403 length:1830 start_codon:yes stop_codon:yes gene_type:complete